LENWDEDKENGDRLCAPYAFHTHFAAWVLPRYEEKIKLLVNAGYQGHFSVEHHSSRNEYVEVEWQLANIRRILTHMQSEEKEG
jgi:hypothetical protein